MVRKTGALWGFRRLRSTIRVENFDHNSGVRILIHDFRSQDYTPAAATHRESDFDAGPAIVGRSNRGIETGIDDRSLVEQLAPPSCIAPLSRGLFYQLNDFVAHASGELQG